MVSVVLLTTEECLSRNEFWCHLDFLWDVEDLEPFEEIKPEHVFIKPLSRDTYYAKFPDIVKSESEEESSMTVLGFRNKLDVWKTKVKNVHHKRRRLSKSNRTNSTSHLNKNISTPNTFLKNITDNTHDDRVKTFLKKLVQNIPPPPLEETFENSEPQQTQQDNSNNLNEISTLNTLNGELDLNVDLPDYSEFERDKNPEITDNCSTLKKKESCSKQTIENVDSWYETIYGISELIDDITLQSKESSLEDNSLNITVIDRIIQVSGSQVTENLIQDCNFEWWPEIECDYDNEISFSYTHFTSNISQEELISQSHVDSEICDFSFHEDSETEYSKFAINKIYQSIRQEYGMPDSSSMENLVDDIPCNEIRVKFNSSFYENAYRLSTFDDLVNENSC